MSTCEWIYRPGRNCSMWATAKCDNVCRPLTRLGLSVPNNEKEGCADWYNGRMCPKCGNAIHMNYDLIKTGVKVV